jgi:hypothetical protein
VGLAIGVLGLWHGASLSISGGLGLVLLTRFVLRARKPGTRLDLRRPGLLLLGAALPLSLLLGPQLLRYHTLKANRSAALWMEPYLGKSAAEALRLALVPRDAGLILISVFLLRVVAGRRLGLGRWRRAEPLAMAWLVCLVLGHVGFLLADETRPWLKDVLEHLIPVPPHTFWELALGLAPVLKVLGMLSLLQMAARVLPRWAWCRDGVAAWNARPSWAQPLLALPFAAALLFRPPMPEPLVAGSESREFFEFSKKVAATIGDTAVFFRYPGRLLQGGALKIPLVSVWEYANPYVQHERSAALDKVDAALARGDAREARRYFRRYGFGYLMEDPRRQDPVVQACGGTEVMRHQGYVLRRHERCR